MKKRSVKSWLFENIINESEQPFYRLAPTDVKSIANATLNSNKKVFSLSFTTNDGRDMKLKVKDKLFYDWSKKQPDNNDSDTIKEFLFWFLNNSKPREDKMIAEIVDEYNNLIGDEDLPKDVDNRMIGLSSVDSDIASYQTRTKSKNYNSWGLGFITW